MFWNLLLVKLRAMILNTIMSSVHKMVKQRWISCNKCFKLLAFVWQFCWHAGVAGLTSCRVYRVCSVSAMITSQKIVNFCLRLKFLILLYSKKWIQVERSQTAWQANFPVWDFFLKYEQIRNFSEFNEQILDWNLCFLCNSI